MRLSREGKRKLTAQQRRVINTKGVKLIGFDANDRPVVEAPHWLDNRKTDRWALLRNGDPADIKEIGS